MTSRRQFLGATAAGMSLLTAARSRAAKTFSDVYPFAEFESRIAKRDFRDMTKDLLPTPCMVVDLDMFNANVKHMADTAKANGINVRPHVKVHKSVDVGKRQVAHGAVGLTVATIAEAELFSGAGTKGVCGPSSRSASTTPSGPSCCRRRTPPSCSWWTMRK